MNQEDQQEVFSKELEKLIDRMREELEITNASIIGCIEIIKMNLYQEALEDEDEDEHETN